MEGGTPQFQPNTVRLLVRSAIVFLHVWFDHWAQIMSHYQTSRYCWGSIITPSGVMAFELLMDVCTYMCMHILGAENVSLGLFESSLVFFISPPLNSVYSLPLLRLLPMLGFPHSQHLLPISSLCRISSVPHPWSFLTFLVSVVAPGCVYTS